MTAITARQATGVCDDLLCAHLPSHRRYECCGACNHARHLCPGCGEWVGHGRSVCDACSGSEGRSS